MAKGYKSFGMEFPDIVVPIDPYFLGLWLGDGHSRELCVTNSDEEVLSYLTKYAEKMGGNLKEQNSPKVYRIRNCGYLSKQMREMGIMTNRRNGGSCKHIPKEFIKTTRENRLQLLAGLLDTDGYLQKDKRTFEIVLAIEELADDIVLLCRTLGLYVNKGDKIVNGANYYRLTISGETSEIPTKVKRKRASQRKQIKCVSHTGVVVEKDIVDDYYGFTLDGDHLFCLQDFTVTHNTWLLVYLCYLLEKVLIDNDIDGEVLFISNEMGEEEIKERLDAMRFRLPYRKFLSGKLTPREKTRYFRGLDSLKKTKSRIRILYSCQTMDELATFMGIYQPKAVFIDGSYLMEGKMMEGWEKMVYITRNLKRIGKNFAVPIINTTQLKRGAGKGGSKETLDGQDEFAYSGSYAQDSDIAFRMYQDADMKYHDLVGLEVVKGRRVQAGTTVMFENNLGIMAHSLTLPIEDEITEPERETDY